MNLILFPLYILFWIFVCALIVIIPGERIIWVVVELFGYDSLAATGYSFLAVVTVFLVLVFLAFAVLAFLGLRQFGPDDRFE